MSKNNANNNNNQNNNNHNQKKNNETADAWAENLKRNQEQRLKDSKWFNMQPGEKTVLEFLPEFGPVMKDFGDRIAETLRYEYKVIDVNHRDAGPKPWDVSKSMILNGCSIFTLTIIMKILSFIISPSSWQLHD